MVDLGELPEPDAGAAAAVFVAEHGVAARASAYPPSVTAHMLWALSEGRATAAVLAAHVGAHLEVVDVGVGRPTADLSCRPALDEERFSQCWGAGASAVAGLEADLVVLGEMGIGNTTPAGAAPAGASTTRAPAGPAAPLVRSMSGRSWASVSSFMGSR